MSKVTELQKGFFKKKDSSRQASEGLPRKKPYEYSYLDGRYLTPRQLRRRAWPSGEPVKPRREKPVHEEVLEDVTAEAFLKLFSNFFNELCVALLSAIFCVFFFLLLYSFIDLPEVPNSLELLSHSLSVES